MLPSRITKKSTQLALNAQRLSPWSPAFFDKPIFHYFEQNGDIREPTYAPPPREVFKLTLRKVSVYMFICC